MNTQVTGEIRQPTQATLELSYTLSKQIPDMARGFVIQTGYGDIVIDADDAQPFIGAVTKVINRKLKQANGGVK